MLASHVIQNCINDLKAITKCDLAVVDAEGVKTVSTDTDMEIPMSDVESFINSDAESQTINGFWFLKVIHEFDLAYIVISKDDPQSVMSARIAASSLSGLLLAIQHLPKPRFRYFIKDMARPALIIMNYILYKPIYKIIEKRKNVIYNR